MVCCSVWPLNVSRCVCDMYPHAPLCKHPVLSPGTWFEQWSYLEIDDRHSTKGACEGDSSGGFKRKWARPSYAESAERCLVLPPAPQCLQAPWSRVNHLGNGRDGVALNYDWVLPHFPSGDTQRCVFRMRWAGVVVCTGCEGTNHVCNVLGKLECTCVKSLLPVCVG